MFTKTSLFFCFFIIKLTSSTSSEAGFTYNGFKDSDLKLDGIASVTPGGLLQLTNEAKVIKGHAFHLIPLHFKSQSNKVFSFSTTFAFAILSPISYLSGHGITFFISPTTDLSTALPSQYLGLFNTTYDGNPNNHIFAVELDTILNHEFNDIDDNHVGIDINTLKSYNSSTAGYYEDVTGLLRNLTLMSGRPMQVWVDYDGNEMQLNVTLSPIQMPKPNRPLLSSTVNLSSVMLDPMYVGFSSSTGSVLVSHCILGWSFKMNGTAEPLDYAKLPSLPRIKTKGRSLNPLEVWLPIAFCTFVLLILVAVMLIVRRRIIYAELLEDWERQYRPHRFSYKALFLATKGFKDERLVGTGGFGRVYRGVLPSSRKEVAIKIVSHEPRGGMKEFVAEIVSIIHLRHQNLVQILGYCRRKGELILVYDFMPNGSLHRFLYDETKPKLNWAQRFKIIKGVASGLSYLHDNWEPHVLIHRDIKACNVLLDNEFNGKLGDFFHARLCDNGTDRLIGTMGYLAPELARTGKATTMTDVFAFGVLLLEVTCGRRPVRHHTCEDLVLIDWVLESWRSGSLIDTMDPRLRDGYCAQEVELVLKLGLLCSHPMPAVRPSMQRAMQILNRNVELPLFSPS